MGIEPLGLGPAATARRASFVTRQEDVITVGVRSDATSLYARAATCGGDSGGPLFEDLDRLIAVASWRSPGPCGTGTSVFTRTDTYQPWIEKAVRELSETSVDGDGR